MNEHTTTRARHGFQGKGHRWAMAQGMWADGFGGPGRRRQGLPGGWRMGGPGFGFPGGGFGRPRSRRGDVRFAALSLLAERPMHGYQIITELSERSGGAWRPSPGSIYPTLQQLEDEGLVTACEQDGRRTFSITDAGRAEVADAGATRRAPWEQLAEEDGDAARNLRSTAAQVMAAVWQVMSAGDERQVQEAERLLNDTRKSLYRLLAEEDPGTEA